MYAKIIRVFEGFAGYGGASFGLKRSGLKYKVVGMSEFDKFASLLIPGDSRPPIPVILGHPC